MREGASGRALAGDRVIERGAQRVDVGPRALAPARLGVLLVGAVARLHERGDGLGVRGDLAACRAEVDEHRIARLADDDVVGRDVAMQEVGLVDQLERIEQRRQDGVELLLARRAAERLQPALEALALLEVEHHVAGVVGAEVAIDAHDVRVIELGERLRFLDEAIEAPAVVAGAVLASGARPRCLAARAAMSLGKYSLMVTSRASAISSAR